MAKKNENHRLSLVVLVVFIEEEITVFLADFLLLREASDCLPPLSPDWHLSAEQ